jgi:beta-galactosidase
MQGAYRAFWARNIQADWVHIDDVDQYSRLYLPMPIMLRPRTAEQLLRWVAAGGTPISEGCPAYFGDLGRVGTVQPNCGLDELFGARQSDVEFTPDLLTDLKLSVNLTPVWGGVFLQAYEPGSGRAVGWYLDGRVAAVENHVGSGHTLLLGTMPGAGYVAHAAEDGDSAFFTSLLELGDAPQPQHVTSTDSRVKARLHAGEGGLYLWVANPTRQSVPVQLDVREHLGDFSATRTVWGSEAACDGRVIKLTAAARDVTVLELVQ